MNERNQADTLRDMVMQLTHLLLLTIHRTGTNTDIKDVENRLGELQREFDQIAENRGPRMTTPAKMSGVPSRDLKGE